MFGMKTLTYTEMSKQVQKRFAELVQQDKTTPRPYLVVKVVEEFKNTSWSRKWPNTSVGEEIRLMLKVS
jgi:hypothetical protein